MRLAFWRKAPTRPGGAKGIRFVEPGWIDVTYMGCDHVIRWRSNNAAPYTCPHKEHVGWEPEPNPGVQWMGQPHYYYEDDRCRCGAVVVYHEDTRPPGYGCEAEGKPWNDKVRRMDPQVRRDENRG